MSDPTKGVIRKYEVSRTDGSSQPGGKHERCSYFVLDLEHDEFSIPALEAYAVACKAKFPALAQDLERVLATRPCGCRAVSECMHSLNPQTPGAALTAAINANTQE
jgi:hypothetical protein